MREDGNDVRFDAHSGLASDMRRVRKVQIVLQKSFCSTGHKFSELWARRSNNHVGDHIN